MAVFMLTPLGAASILLSPGDTITSVGDSLTLSCTAAGIPAPQISWYKDGLLLTTGLDNITETQSSNASNHFTVSDLNLCDLQLSDSGQYSCVASNSISAGTVTDTRSFMLEAQGELS